MSLSASRLSARFLALWRANPSSGFTPSLTTAQLASLQAQADALAQAVVEELGHAAVSVPGVAAGSATATGTVS
jgi:hypothetical protein